jgi:hypothetical protein
MNITFNLNTIVKQGLSADDFTICMLLKDRNLLSLKKYDKILEGTLYKKLQKIKNLGFIRFMGIGDMPPLESIQTTLKFLELISQGDMFEELYNSYPSHVTRPDGKKDYLRSGKVKAKIKYLKLVKDNKTLHDHILACLRYELEQKEKTGSMMYMKRLLNWITEEEYMKYENYLKFKVPKSVEETTNTSQLNINTYGTNFL